MTTKETELRATILDLAERYVTSDANAFTDRVINAIRQHSKPTELDTQELREQIAKYIYLSTETLDEAREKADKLLALIAQREQAAELRGRVDENRRAGARWGGLVPTEKLNQGTKYMNDREAVLRQATKPEKGE